MHIIAAQTSIQLKLLFLTAFCIFHIQFKHEFAFIFLQSDIRKVGSTVGYTQTKPDKVKNRILISKDVSDIRNNCDPTTTAALRVGQGKKKKKKALTIQTRIYLIFPRFERCCSRTGGGRDRKDRRRKSKP